jgi:hypothetical protein
MVNQVFSIERDKTRVYEIAEVASVVCRTLERLEGMLVKDVILFTEGYAGEIRAKFTSHLVRFMTGIYSSQSSIPQKVKFSMGSDRFIASAMSKLSRTRQLHHLL